MKSREATALAENVVSKARTQQARIALYLKGDEVRSTKVGSMTFYRLEAHNNEDLIGVYGSRCDPEWIKDDILDATKGKS